MEIEMAEYFVRGKTCDTKKWICGFFWKDIWGDGESCFILYDNVDYKVDPRSVGRSSGLLDKNKNTIFEGDIILSHYKNAKKSDFVEQVVFINGKFFAMYSFDTGRKMYSPLTNGLSHLPKDKSVYMEYCEVIGNIYDNPELLQNRGSENDS